MGMGADVRHATLSAVPSGLMQFRISVPNVETLGYYRPSLRDDEWQILVALDILVRFSGPVNPEADKNVRAPEKVIALSLPFAPALLLLRFCDAPKTSPELHLY